MRDFEGGAVYADLDTLLADRARRFGDRVYLEVIVLKDPKTAQMFKGLDRALIVRVLDRIRGGFGDGCLSRSGFALEMRLAEEYKLVKRAITFEEFADTRFAGECP